MPYFTSNNARIYYEDMGRGDPIIAVGGLMENTAYWSLPGVSFMLAENYRFVSMDMRGHGYTVADEDMPGFDEETVAKDIIALADHLGVEKFHVLAHSTGGYAAVRYAMQDCSRFKSLILTNTASFTSLASGDSKEIEDFHDAIARGFEKLDWEKMFDRLRQKPGAVFRGIMESGNSEEMIAVAMSMAERNDRFTLARFVRSFYRDPDPRAEQLKNIVCPVLIIYGEKDPLFVEPSRLMAEKIPYAKLLEYEGVGHMSAIEAPERLAGDIHTFLKNLEENS